jgi:hypothetical protein
MKPQRPEERNAAPAQEKSAPSAKPAEAATLEIVEETGVEDLL